MAMVRMNRSNGCWIDLFDQPHLAGHTRRLIGPADFPFLCIAEPGWGHTLNSIVVGPGAYVQCYEAKDFFATVFWLLPNQLVRDVSELNLSEQINSMRLYDRPPFAHEPGYAPYMLWAAAHIATVGTPLARP